MRHRKAGRRLSRSGGHRKALYRNLITELFRHERIRTTEAKARAIRGKAEKLITLSRRGMADTILELARANDEQGLAALVQAKRADKLLALAREAEGLSGDEQAAKEAELEAAVRALGVHARRQASSRVTDPVVLRKLFDELGPRYRDRPGGYTRMLKLGRRQGDAAAMAFIELVED
ncbi:MAG TPA: 50S ribosomal protein L17 [Anaerolineae bacterium]|nr:50S ribosomal protein L17 [Anaerolineae bacterium]